MTHPRSLYDRGFRFSRTPTHQDFSLQAHSRLGASTRMTPMLLFQDGGFGDAFIAAYDQLGALIWVKVIGGAGQDVVTDIAVDSNDAIYWCGNYQGTVTVVESGTTHTVSSEGADDAMVGQLAPDGTTMWLRSFGGTDSDNATALSVGDNGHHFLDVRALTPFGSYAGAVYGVHTTTLTFVPCSPFERLRGTPCSPSGARMYAPAIPATLMYSTLRRTRDARANSEPTNFAPCCSGLRLDRRRQFGESRRHGYFLDGA